MVNKWKEFFINLYELEELTFMRTLKSSNALGRPSLIIFSDGSMQANGACAYVRWQIVDPGDWILMDYWGSRLATVGPLK